LVTKQAAKATKKISIRKITAEDKSVTKLVPLENHKLDERLEDFMIPVVPIATQTGHHHEQYLP
jgi:hypothetical protein